MAVFTAPPVSVGRPVPEAAKIYRTTLDAQSRAIDAAKQGMRSADLDAVARTCIRTSGYEKYFRHSLGHGLGLGG